MECRMRRRYARWRDRHPAKPVHKIPSAQSRTARPPACPKCPLAGTETIRPPARGERFGRARMQRGCRPGRFRLAIRRRSAIDSARLAETASRVIGNAVASKSQAKTGARLVAVRWVSRVVSPAFAARCRRHACYAYYGSVGSTPGSCQQNLPIAQADAVRGRVQIASRDANGISFPGRTNSRRINGRA